MFTKSKWIWKENKSNVNEYVEFVGNFSCEKNQKTIINVSFDSVCNIYINGKLVFFKQCSDYPYYKLYDSIDVTNYCKENNQIKFCVWYYGEDNSSYYNSNAGLIFEVKQEENILLYSNENILCRQDDCYKNGEIKKITGQLGFSFYYDNTVENNLEFTKSVVVEKTYDLRKNTLKQLVLSEKSKCEIIEKNSNNQLIDLLREETGFLCLDIESEDEQEVLITYGEHIVDGKVRRKIDTRDFSCQVKLKKGKNLYTNYFRRLAGRYIQIYFTKAIKINYLGLVPVYYPHKIKPFKANNDVQQKIYDTSVRTLTLCMHEHYEDCPWREQAMYVLDSKNQMLCGYYAFENGNFDYARHQLVLMSKGVKEDGLLELTYPAKDTPSIPFFSIMYPVTVEEYIEYSKDTSILEEVMFAIEKIVNAFKNRVESNGLIANLPYPYWNFYEWSFGSDNENEIMRSKDEPYVKKYDLLLNCAYVLCLEAYDKLKGTKTNLSLTRKAIKDTFYNKEKNLYFADTLNKDLYTELGNSFAILSGVEESPKELCEKLKTKTQMVEVTLSMIGFKYDALLKDSSQNINYVVSDIEQKYSYMLENGATSFWETIKGEADFSGAGSLCHGWSSLPIYYLNKTKIT